ncbi:MAG: flagellar basal body rod modification protein [bacterium ADurb.Bin478]|nr:MAG: flagellar basal body rod modification protein [bacterium ADurb.Bin478]
MKKGYHRFGLLVLILLVISFASINAGTIQISLLGTDPLVVDVKGVGSDQQARSISLFVYFRDDGITDLARENVNSQVMTDLFAWGSLLETKEINTGSWLKGGHTYTRCINYALANLTGTFDDYWTTTGIPALILDFSSVGSGHVFIESQGPDAFTDWSNNPHTVTYANQDVTLPVELSAFSAIMENGRVLLKWTTESERDNLGFNIMRADEKEGAYKKINSRLIEGAGNSTTRTEYQYYDDRDIHVNTTYYYKLQDLDINGGSRINGPVEVFVDRVFIPDQFYLNQNHPNPFNPSTAIRYGLPEAANVRVEVYNLRGELVRILQNSSQSAGAYELIWDGRNSSGQTVPSGVYLYRLSAGNFVETRKMLFTK